MATETPEPKTAAATRRAKNPPLTEDQIVAAALAVIKAEGLEALSMRRLSRELGRSAMAAYWHVTDKQELLELVGRKLLSEVDIPPADSGPWNERLRTVLTNIDNRLHDHPGVASVLLERMTHTDMRLMTGIIHILVDAGFKDSRVFLSYAMIHTYLFGRYQVQVQGAPDQSMPDDLDDTLRDLLPYLGTLRGRDFFAYGIDTLIAGLQAQLDKQAHEQLR
ncbi:TetR/AcrR family transcriptional regulator C-terminal domain-containing protein [Mycolicibacterium fluoranthenivorans]|uniref:TetR/AcrR family transcriptional regulator C-terminal domain-containing protein n=1 Tax=Mycolicibacterium fluoranthenivorans TaxID=258505 RepID=UPI0038B278E9